MVLLKHQTMFLSALKIYKQVRYFWMVGGYRCGKSMTIVHTIIDLAEQYAYQDVVIGVGSPTISLIEKTILLELEKILKRHGQVFDYNKQSHILTLNGVKFVMVPTSYPSDIYAYTFNAFLCDELDELNEEYGTMAFTALDERCSKAFPDGRPPFLAFYSTAQGYKTIYSTIKKLEEIGTPYILIRGKTKDNFYNDPSYFLNRWKLYNENERLAFLEGCFVNLTTGRVYPDYIDTINDCEPFELMPNDTIYVGQDINDFFNKTVGLVKREKKLYVCFNESVPNIGDVPQVLRNKFPTQEILFFPDCGGQSKTIMKAYLNEFKIYNIKLRMGTSNPKIIERVFIINKLFCAKLMYVFKTCKAMSMALKVRGFNKLGLPEKGHLESSPDHYCDSLEYVVYRIVHSDVDFLEFIRTVSRNGQDDKAA